MRLSFEKIFYAIATVVGIFAILVAAKVVLIPVAFAFILAFILFPVAQKYESWGVKRIMAAFLSISSFVVIIGGSIFLFSNQIIRLTNNLSDFKNKILGVLADATLFINKNSGVSSQLEKGDLFNKIKVWVNESSGAFLSQTFSGTAGFLVGLLTAIVFTFLILIYRNGLVQAFVSFFPKANRKKAFNMFKAIQQVGQQYLFGMMIIVLVLGSVNSIGLWIIGIDSPFLFGFLAAALAIVPYVGTVTGAAIPIIYAFMIYDSIWMPISIAIFFWFVQVIESNFLSPKIVGGNLQINALASILSIIIGAAVWGIAGMILFLPFAAMLKVVCEQYEELKPIALLISEQNNNKNATKEESIGKWVKKLKRSLSKFRTLFKRH